VRRVSQPLLRRAPIALLGVATRLHGVDTVYRIVLMVPARVDTITVSLAEAEAAPEELSTINRVCKALPARTRPGRAPTSCVPAQAVNEAASRAERIGEFWGPEDTRLRRVTD
jgi:hypothetical protein